MWRKNRPEKVSTNIKIQIYDILSSNLFFPSVNNFRIKNFPRNERIFASQTYSSAKDSLLKFPRNNFRHFNYVSLPRDRRVNEGSGSQKKKKRSKCNIGFNSLGTRRFLAFDESLFIILSSSSCWFENDLQCDIHCESILIRPVLQFIPSFLLILSIYGHIIFIYVWAVRTCVLRVNTKFSAPVSEFNTLLNPNVCFFIHINLHINYHWVKTILFIILPCEFRALIYKITILIFS